MRVMVHPAGEDACGFYRLQEPARVLADQGADVTSTREVAWRFAHDADGRPYRLVEEVDADVVVFQRPLRRVKLDMIRCLQDAGVAVVVELDDDFGSVHPRNAAWPEAHKEWMSLAEARERGLLDASTPAECLSRSGRQFRRYTGTLAHSSNLWLRRACEAADLVTVTTPALAERYAPHGRVAVLPNLVPERYLSIEAERDGVTVGWGGSMATHPDDLEATGGGVGRAVAECGARFSVVGDGEGVQRALGLEKAPSVVGWVGLDRWPFELARFDVGIVPLAPSPFNAAKSWLKGLELAAVGVPFVASPTPEYVRLARTLPGVVLAATPDEWHHAVRAMVDSPSGVAALAHENREACRGWTYEARAQRWHDAWADALTHRRAQRSAA